MKINNRAQNLIRLILLILTLTAVYILSDKILLLKNRDGTEQFRSFYLQKKNTVDVLFVGNSHSYCHINPGILWTDYGISSFDLGGAEQTPSLSYYYIKEALKTQSPKVVCLDISFIDTSAHEYIRPEFLITNILGMRYNENRWLALKDNVKEGDLKNYILPLGITHGRYAELTRSDFVSEYKTAGFKGFYGKERIEAFTPPEGINNTERLPLTDKEEKDLKRIIDLLKSEDIPLFLMVTPYIVDAESQAKFNTVFDMADECGVSWTDLNQLSGEMQLDYDTDFAEEDHLNRSGSTKLSFFLGKMLKEKYALSDHRGDPAFSSWDQDAERAKQEFAASYMKSIEDTDTFFDLFLNGRGTSDFPESHYTGNPKDYVLFVQLYDDPDEMAANILDDLASIGIKAPVKGRKYMIDGKECVYSTDDTRFRTAFSSKRDDLVFGAEEVSFEGETDYKTRVRIGSEVHSIPRTDTRIVIYDKVLNRVVSEISIDSSGNLSVSEDQS